MTADQERTKSSTAAQVLLEGLVDYAGLFPPASQDMRAAVESYASYRGGPDRHALGRFIVPIARLGELESAARGLMPSGEGSGPWRLSVLVGDNARAAGEQMLKFNCHHWSGSADGHALIDAVELRASTVEAIHGQHSELPAFFQRYFEIPLDGDVDRLIRTIARVGGRAKVRTGGTTADAFPAARDLLAFLAACERENVPFKATAGLHHPVRGSYKLTYQPNSETGSMFGFLNLVIASALLRQGEPERTVLAVLEETDPRTFEFSEEAVSWRGHRVDVSQLRAVRGSFAISFGSCSFREPVDELTQLISAHA